MLQQTGRLLVLDPQYPAQTVNTTDPAALYAFYSYIDLIPSDSMYQVDGTCNNNLDNAQYTDAMNACAGQHGNNCCLDMTHYNVSSMSSLLPSFASCCWDMMHNSMCAMCIVLIDLHGNDCCLDTTHYSGSSMRLLLHNLHALLSRSCCTCTKLV